MPSFRRNTSVRSRSRVTVTITAISALAVLSLLCPIFLTSNEDSSGDSHLPDPTKKTRTHKFIRNSLQDVESMFPQQLIAEAERLQEKVLANLELHPRAVTSNHSTLSTLHNSSASNQGDSTDPKDSEGESDDTEGTLEAAVPIKPVINTSDPGWIHRNQERQKRSDVRVILLTTKEADLSIQPADRKRNVSGLSSHTSFGHEDGSESSNDQLVRLMRDQLIMARGYIAIAQQHGDSRLVKELRMRLKEGMKSVGDATKDAELPSTAAERMRIMGQLLAKARDKHYDCSTMVKKLRSLVQAAEDQGRTLKKQTTYLSQLAAKTLPRGLNCLSLRLTLDYGNLPSSEREFGNKRKLTDDTLFHYALFSDNVLAASVVVNSTVVNAKDSSLHVFHIVTDQLNYAAMRMWFLLNPPLLATLEVLSVDDFKWLNSSYCPVLRQLESSTMKEYYFKANAETTAIESQTLKYRNPKYLSMLNHLRFYLPEVFPTLSKILFVDDDIVVQEDLTPLWTVDLEGNVNGAVETCGESFHRYDKYLNFSHPLIAANFDPQACGWAYGMNVFDLKAWRRYDMTGVYHSWQSKNEDRLLWKLGTLPPGLMTFYNRTKPISKHWHALGMGYNPNLDIEELKKAAVVHYNGNMKPWLDIGMAKYKGFWTKYVKYGHPLLQRCNIN